jgi:flavin prenyltransferase
MSRKICIAVTGASGSVYAKLLTQKLSALPKEDFTIAYVLSDNAKEVWSIENGSKYSDDIPFNIYSKTDFSAPFASGSAKFELWLELLKASATI